MFLLFLFLTNDLVSITKPFSPCVSFKSRIFAVSSLTLLCDEFWKEMKNFTSQIFCDRNGFDFAQKCTLALLRVGLSRNEKVLSM